MSSLARRLLGCLVFATIVLGPTWAANEEEKDALVRLMSEPLTLFDWGLAQLDRDIAVASRRALRRRIGDELLKSGAIYDRRGRRVTIYLTVTAPQAERTREACAGLHMDVLHELIRGGPAGPGAPGWCLLNAFQPQAHYWACRFENIGHKLLNKAPLEVSLVPARFDTMLGDARRVRCTGRLDAEAGELEFDVTS